jgi:sulfide:quinone oxidoreductase
MQIIPISSSVSVADQIDERDVQTLAAAGFKSVVGHRPDIEGGTPVDLIRAACVRHGLKFFFQPVEFSKLGLPDADRFGQILQQTEGPLLAYCRSGRRSAALWALACAPLAGVQPVLERTARAGIGLEELRPLLDLNAARTDLPYAPGADPAARERFAQRWCKDR